MSDYDFTMPYPPSINGYWKPFRNRIILSKRGREYRQEALKQLENMGLGCELIHDNVIVSITLNPPSLRRYDLDNYCKGILDALTHAKFWIDDEQVQKLTIIKGKKTKGGIVRVSVDLIKPEIM